MTTQQTYRWDTQPGPVGPGWFAMVARYTAPLAGLPGGGGSGKLTFVRGVYGPREPPRKKRRPRAAPAPYRQDAELLALLLLTRSNE